MTKIEKDNKGNVVLSVDGLSCLINAYSPKFKALKVSFGYNTPNEMAKIITTIFSFEKKIVANYTNDKDATFENVCFYYCGSKVIIKKDMTKEEITKMLFKIEQG